MNQNKRKEAETLPGPDLLTFNSQIAARRYEYLKQNDILKQSFSERPKTMLQASFETGILRANICRYIAKLRRENKIHLVKVGLCPITKCRAGYYQMKGAGNV
jgi:hypothetical protein